MVDALLQSAVAEKDGGNGQTGIVLVLHTFTVQGDSLANGDQMNWRVSTRNAALLQVLHFILS